MVQVNHGASAITDHHWPVTDLGYGYDGATDGPN